MDLGLRGKVALVPAASQGLGKAVALAFAREGARLAICSRRLDAIESTAEEARRLGAEVLALAADLTRAEDIANLVQRTVDQFGGIDILITNAGGPPAGRFDDFDDAAWQAGYELTLLSAIRLIRAALPSMRQRGGGVVITMTSSSIKQPISNLILSNVFRAGVAALAKTLADELAPDNIRVNNVVPGRIATERIVQLDQANAARLGVDVETVRQSMLAQIPLRRYGEPEEFADAVVFLASERASYITGATLQVDGGMIRSLW
ncbi:SDR family oxidoreductase [Thermomicrobiaceae bacterium CFH 74404]|uniref:SDR family oxidoreductase n=1 Tax=Thermalbibacter longus TaxID=2951981 RepID=A0AA41WH38_9BACT|nr:SDR family oxidoreductase [Thermalbibacter longus]MCM8749915.1 SDR family oxidoreductase [Thermalbibacter longus]